MASIIKSNQMKEYCKHFLNPLEKKVNFMCGFHHEAKLVLQNPHPLNKFIIVVYENISSVVLCTEMYDRT